MSIVYNVSAMDCVLAISLFLSFLHTHPSLPACVYPNVSIGHTSVSLAAESSYVVYVCMASPPNTHTLPPPNKICTPPPARLSAAILF